jgi:MoaA/NifB/PqqE/SkfB family radical SAM enzyme
MSKHFCPIPFHHFAIRPDGKAYPCCYFRHESVPKDFNLSHPDLFNHPYLLEIREKLRNDQPVEGCIKCYENEKLTGSSMRTDYIKASYLGFKDTPPQTPELTYIDLALSNVCNNRCRMCGPELSTNWYADAKKLGMHIPSGLIKHENNLDKYDLSKLTYIKLIGGEPLMEQEKFINVLNKCNLKNLTILVTTNSTQIPETKLLDLLKQCKKVKWILSIDSYGKLNDFLRKGSDWNLVANNIKWFENNFKGNVNIHSVASIYNINVVNELIDYVGQNHPSIKVKYVPVDGPDWMLISNLPEDVKDLVINKLKKTVVIDSLNILINEIKHQGNIKKFIEQDKKINEIRNEEWKDLNPELYQWLKNYFEDSQSTSISGK